MEPKSPKTLDTYELESTDEDISFAIFCLLKDLTDIRHYVRQTVSVLHILLLFSPLTSILESVATQSSYFRMLDFFRLTQNHCC
jgi:hypothetical protein